MVNNQAPGVSTLGFLMGIRKPPFGGVDGLVHEMPGQFLGSPPRRTGYKVGV